MTEEDRQLMDKMVNKMSCTWKDIIRALEIPYDDPFWGILRDKRKAADDEFLRSCGISPDMELHG